MLWRRKKTSRQPPTPIPPRESPQKPSLPQVVESYLAEVDQADRLAATDETSLNHARTNPRVLAHRVSSQDRLHRRLIELEDDRQRLRAERVHARLVEEIEAEQRWAAAAAARDDRAITHAQRDADLAAARCAAVERARQEHDPAQAASILARSRGRDMRAYLGFAVAASTLSAVGIARLAIQNGAGVLAATAFAVVAEAALTVLVTFIISRQAHTDHYAELGRDANATRIAAQIPSWAANLPWLGVMVLLVASVAFNAYGALTGTGIYGAFGIAGALGAALCSLLAWAHSIAVSAHIKANLDDHHIQAGLEELRRRASGEYIPTRVPSGEGTEAEPSPAEETVALAERIADRVVRRVIDDMTATREVLRGAGERAPESLLHPADADYLADLEARMGRLLGEDRGGPSGGGSGGVALADPDDAPGSARRDAPADAIPETRHETSDAVRPDPPEADAATRSGSASASGDAPGSAHRDADHDAGGDAPGTNATRRTQPSRRRRSRGASRGAPQGSSAVTIAQVREYFATHPQASNRRAARELGTSEATIRRRLNGISHP